jgi:hypothetical protein
MIKESTRFNVAPNYFPYRVTRFSMNKLVCLGHFKILFWVSILNLTFDRSASRNFLTTPDAFLEYLQPLLKTFQAQPKV